MQEENALSQPSTEGSPRTLAGQCLCGDVQYEVVDAFPYAQNCHCSNCRCATGSAFKPFAGFEPSKLRITKGTVVHHHRRPAAAPRVRLNSGWQGLLDRDANLRLGPAGASAYRPALVCTGAA